MAKVLHYFPGLGPASLPVDKPQVKELSADCVPNSTHHPLKSSNILLTAVLKSWTINEAGFCPIPNPYLAAKVRVQALPTIEQTEQGP